MVLPDMMTGMTRGFAASTGREVPLSDAVDLPIQRFSAFSPSVTVTLRSVASQARLAAWEKNLDNFEAAGKAQNLGKLTQSMSDDLKEAKEERAEAVKGLVSVLTAAFAQAGLKLVGPVGSVAELAAGVIYLHLADERVTVLESNISQTTVSLENNRRRLQYEIAREKATSGSVQRDITQLTTKTYLDLR